MTLIQFFRLFNRNLNLLLLSALSLAVVTYLLTRNLPKTYESSTEIYTGIASGIDIGAVDVLKVDYLTTSTEFDNLLNIIQSDATLEEVGMRLLVQHMMLDSADPAYISEENYEHFKYKMPDSIKNILLDPYSVENTLRRVRYYREKYWFDERVKLTFDMEASPYSRKAIDNIRVRRIQSSDLINISYSFNDPGIAQNTLLILTEVFRNNVAKIKSGQSEGAVRYFSEKVAEAAKALNEAEDNLQNFRIENRVINYQEQTKSLAIRKESMEEAYQDELAAQRAAKAAVEKIEEQLSLNNVMIQLGQDFLNTKTELIDLRAQIAELETYLNDADLLQRLRDKAQKLEEKARNILSKRFQYSRTTDGVPVTRLINEWITHILEYDATTARVAVFQERKSYFQREYDKYAPLGSMFARLERDISIKEKNYLEMLNSLNQALLRQRGDMEATGGQVVTQAPEYPRKAEAGKEKLLILVAGVFGFVLPLLFILLRELLDQSIRTPERGEELTGLKLLGAYPDLTARSQVKNVNFEWLHEKASGLLVQNLRLQSLHKGSKHLAKNILVFSTRAKDGKQLTTHVLANELSALNMRVLVMAPKALPESEKPYYDYVVYENDTKFLNSEHITELVPLGFDPMLYDYIFMIVDGILTNPYPLNLLPQFHFSVCVTGAFRDWNRADKVALEELSQTMGQEPLLLLNGVEPDFMSSVLGEIEKQRSWVRRFIKGILSLQLKSSGRSFNTKGSSNGKPERL